MPISDMQIKALQPRDKRYLVRRWPRPLTRYSAQRIQVLDLPLHAEWQGGKITLGPYPDLTLKAARDKRDKLAGAVVGGQSPAAEKKARTEGRGGHQTVRQFGDRYYREQVVRNPRTRLRSFATWSVKSIRRSETSC